MTTDDLIQQLGRDLRPVRRLSPSWQRATVWLACGVVYVVAAALVGWFRRGALGVEAAAPYVLQQGALAITACFAALAAFASVVPGIRSRATAALSIPLAAIMLALLWGAWRDLEQVGTFGLGRETDWPCVLSITLGGTALWGVASAMLRRGAVLEPRTTSLLAAVAALSLANIEACVSQSHAFAATVIVWHGATAASLMLAVIMVGPWVLVQRPSDVR
jgi:hypothetical protein